MKRIIALVLLLLMVLALPSETIKHSSLGYEYEEYEEDEFPIWSNELRRGEILFFGSFVFTLPISSLALSGLDKVGVISFNSNEDKAIKQVLVASALSLSIACIDWFIGRI